MTSPDLDLLSRVPDPYAGDLGPLPPPPPVGSPAPTRADHRRRAWMAAAGALVVQVLWCAFARHRVPLASVTAGGLASSLGVPAVSAALAAWVAGQRGRRGLGVPVPWLAAGVALAGGIFAVVTLATSPPDPDGGGWLAGAVPCLASSALLCAVSLGLAALVLRRGFAAAAAWRTAAVGVACGALAASTMSVACFHRETLHVLVGHGAMIVVGGLVGGLVGRRFTRA